MRPVVQFDPRRPYKWRWWQSGDALGCGPVPPPISRAGTTEARRKTHTHQHVLVEVDQFSETKLKLNHRHEPQRDRLAAALSRRRSVGFDSRVVHHRTDSNAKWLEHPAFQAGPTGFEFPAVYQSPPDGGFALPASSNLAPSSAGMAQLVERALCKGEVLRSIRSAGTTCAQVESGYARPDVHSRESDRGRRMDPAMAWPPRDPRTPDPARPRVFGTATRFLRPSVMPLSGRASGS